MEHSGPVRAHHRAAGVGNTLGIALASVLRSVNPAITVVLALIAAATAAVAAALFYGVFTLSVLGLTAGLAQSLAKVSLDSTIQHDVHERVQTSALGRSDTLLQLAWVVGGFVGIAIPPTEGRLGLWVAAVALIAWAVYVLGGRAQEAAARRRAAAAGGERAPTQRKPPAKSARRPREEVEVEETQPYSDDVIRTRPYDARSGEAGRTTIVMPPDDGEPRR